MRRTFLLSAVVLTSACGGGGEGGDPDAAPEPSLMVSSTTGFMRVVAGESVVVPVSIDRSGGFTGEVAIELSGLPTGVASQAVVVPEGAGSASVIVQAVASAEQGGPTPVMVRASSPADSAIAHAIEIPLYVAGKPGDVDPSFGAAGFALYAGNAVPKAIAVDPQGRLVVAGGMGEKTQSALVIRFTISGELDASFDQDGAILGLGGTESFAYGLVVRPEGIDVLGFAVAGEYVLFVRRFDHTGRVDGGFGTGGDVVLASETSQTVLASRGAGLIAGFGPVLEAFDASGAPDASFDLPSPLPVAPFTFAADGEGRVVLGARSPDDLRIARLGLDGAVDEAFGTSGILHVPAPGEEDYDYRIPRVHLGSDGGGFASGWANEEPATDNWVPYLVKFTSAGMLDTSFSGDGYLHPEATGFVVDFVVDGAGRPVVLTDAYGSKLRAARLIRYRSNGSPDDDFGSGGVVVIEDDLPSAVVNTGLMTYEAGAERVIVCAPDGGIKCGRYWL
jgi:uncharacterized delta-60 repeat protein